MSAAFLITFREGLEAALIIAIVLAYFRSLGGTDQFKYVFLGAVSAIIISLIVATGVLREGIETALFLIAVFLNNTIVFAGIGSLVGLVGAASIGTLVYKGSGFINIRLFFQITGGFIILVAAGLLSNGIHEFQESGIINIYLSRAWDLTWFPPLSDGQLAEFLKSIVGWRPNPSVGQAVAWVTYLTAATWFFYFAGLTTKAVKRSKP